VIPLSPFSLHHLFLFVLLSFHLFDPVSFLFICPFSLYLLSVEGPIDRYVNIDRDSGSSVIIFITCLPIIHSPFIISISCLILLKPKNSWAIFTILPFATHFSSLSHFIFCIPHRIFAHQLICKPYYFHYLAHRICFHSSLLYGLEWLMAHHVRYCTPIEYHTCIARYDFISLFCLLIGI